MIKTFDYLTTLETIEGEIMAAIKAVLRSGWLILGPETEAFEQAFAAHLGAAHCVGVTSGTMALHLALWSMGIAPGDEVITVANTCTPTIAAIQLAGATPVFVDVREEDLMIDPALVRQAITERTRCILPVHLWGQGVAIDALRDLGIPVLEDCAQAQGTRIAGKHAGTFGAAGCFSFYPTKNLGAYGDAGAVVTDDAELAERLRRKRMYGYTRANYAEEPGMNARISEMQAAILRVKLRYLADWLARRRAIAARYHAEINKPGIRLPHLHSDRDHAYHQFVIRCADRDKVIAALEARAIGYGIHYATPVHQMPPYRHLQRAPLPVTERAAEEILSLPVHEALSEAEVSAVIQAVNEA